MNTVISRYTLSCEKKRISFRAYPVSFLGSIKGLMFTRSFHIPLFFSLRFPFSIHSVCVFYPFVAVWVDEKKNVIRTDTVSPFTLQISPPDGATGLFEIPINKKYSKLCSFLVGKRHFTTLLSSRRTNI